MPEGGKKNQNKNRNDPKEQRRPRQRQQSGHIDKKPNQKSEEPKISIPQKPTYQEPPPEFYKNLKRETEDILKITEEENSKYKKKEIQSNWSKYEMPIESYDEIQEQENMGADYEKLIETPLSIGGHFQFKHEKSWDTDFGPSLYDKYFDINMDNLFVSLTTVPFYERNNINKDIFSEADILTMTNRATKYKQKYYKDKTFTTPELEAQDKILNSLKESIQENKSETTDIKKYEARDEKEVMEDKKQIDLKYTGIGLDLKLSNTKNMSANTLAMVSTLESAVIEEQKDFDNIEDLLLDDNEIEADRKIECNKVEIPLSEVKSPTDNDTKSNHERQKNPIIESPEDLEKWLDDFLDG